MDYSNKEVSNMKKSNGDLLRLIDLVNNGNYLPNERYEQVCNCYEIIKEFASRDVLEIWHNYKISIFIEITEDRKCELNLTLMRKPTRNLTRIEKDFLISFYKDFLNCKIDENMISFLCKSRVVWVSFLKRLKKIYREYFEKSQFLAKEIF